jgi:hypothetical protein
MIQKFFPGITHKIQLLRSFAMNCWKEKERAGGLVVLTPRELKYN